MPLDNYGKYSTSVTLAKALGVKPKKAFAPYFGAMAGVFGKSNCKTVQDLKNKFQKIVKHEVSLYNYGNNEIIDSNVAIIAGGGNEVDFLKEISKAGINTFVTGLTVKNVYYSEAHRYAEKRGINILGGTHYSTEKFACMSMVDYFTEFGLPSEFIENDPIIEDM